jgi:hypothetical protein
MKKRTALRAEAKKLYKEQIKGIPKRQRLPFAKFFKQYKALKLNETNKDKTEESAITEDTDFDFDNIINVNEISDDDLEAPKMPIENEE